MAKYMSRRQFIRTSTMVTMGMVAGCTTRNTFEVIVRNGSIIDGTGAPTSQMDVGIRGGKIVALGDLNTASADQTIDATGYVVAPGFIDIHTHTDTELLVNPRAESKIHQGVTTEIGGNCGDSPFPLTRADFEELARDLQKKYSVTIQWRTLAEFLQAIEKVKPSINYATFTGHGTLRAFTVGKNDVAPGAEQLNQMKLKLAESIDHGSLGLSTGLEYAPGSYAQTDELIELCRVVARKKGIHATHMRNEDDRVEEAVDEALQIARETGVSTEISHLKACNQQNWPKIDRVLEQIQTARQQGLNIDADRYPYTAYGTGLGAFLPLWARQGTTDDVLARLEDKSLLPKIQAYTEGRGDRIGGWDRVLISVCYQPENKRWEGKSIQWGAEQSGQTPFEFIRQLILSERNQAGMVGFAMSEPNLRKVLTAPFVMIGSDGSAVAPYGKLGEGKPHPRYYGAFPRVLGRYCRDEQYFELPIAIQKMTARPAEKAGLKQRGYLKKGYWADITIFNPATVIDQATFQNPHQYPVGIEYVIVNGKITIANGEHTGAQAGQIIRHKPV